MEQIANNIWDVLEHFGYEVSEIHCDGNRNDVKVYFSMDAVVPNLILYFRIDNQLRSAGYYLTNLKRIKGTNLVIRLNILVEE